MRVLEKMSCQSMTSGQHTPTLSPQIWVSVILFSQKCVTPHCHAPPCLVTNISRVWFIIIISALKQWRDTALVTTHEISREQSFSSILTSWCRRVLQIFSQYCWLWSLSREHQTHSAIREIWSSDTMKIILKKYYAVQAIIIWYCFTGGEHWIENSFTVQIFTLPDDLSSWLVIIIELGLSWFSGNTAQFLSRRQLFNNWKFASQRAVGVLPSN